MKLSNLMNEAEKQATSNAKMLTDEKAIEAANNLVKFMLDKGVVDENATAELRKTNYGTFILKIGKKVLGPYVPYKNGERSFKTKSGFTDRRFELWKEATPVDW